MIKTCVVEVKPCKQTRPPNQEVIKQNHVLMSVLYMQLIKQSEVENFEDHRIEFKLSQKRARNR